MPRSVERLVAADGLESTIDLGVDAADEEARHARHRGEIGARVGGEPFQPCEIGLHHLAVAIEAEDQGHVDGASLGDHLLDRRQTLLRARDLDHQIAPIDLLVEVSGSSLGTGAVVGETRIDFHADVPVDAARLVVHLRKDVAGAMDVADHQRPVVVDDRSIEGTHLGELLVVVARPLDRLLEDRGIRGQPPYAAVAQRHELTRGDVAALQVVEPGALALLFVQIDETVDGGHGAPRQLDGAGGWGQAMSSSARCTT